MQWGQQYTARFTNDQNLAAGKWYRSEALDVSPPMIFYHLSNIHGKCGILSILLGPHITAKLTLSSQKLTKHTFSLAVLWQSNIASVRTLAQDCCDWMHGTHVIALIGLMPLHAQDSFVCLFGVFLSSMTYPKIHFGHVQSVTPDILSLLENGISIDVHCLPLRIFPCFALPVPLHQSHDIWWQQFGFCHH